MEQIQPTELGKIFKAQWGWVALRGVLAILFAFIALFYPVATVLTLAALWGIFAIMEGVTFLVSGWGMRKQGSKAWPYFLFGAIGVLAGIAAFAWPGMTSIVLIYLIGIWAIFGGMSEIFMAVGSRREVDRWWVLLLSGVISVLFGMFLLYAPLEGMLALVWVLAAFLMALGVICLVFAVQLKRGKLEVFH